MITRTMQQVVMINPRLINPEYPISSARTNMFIALSKQIRHRKIYTLKYTQKRLDQEAYEQLDRAIRIAPWNNALCMMLLTLEIIEESENELDG